MEKSTDKKNYSVKNRALPPELIKKANEMNILDYLDKKGILVQSIGKGQYQLVDHDSFKINADLTSEDYNKMNWYSRGEGAYGPIGFAKLYYGMNFREAVKDVTETMDEMIESVKPIEKIVHNEKPYEYDPTYITKDTSKIEDYLVNERKINPDLVEALIDKGMIRQTSKKISNDNGKEIEVNNLAFMWNRNGKIIGHDERGIVEGSYFKKIASGVPENRGFSVTFGKPESIFVFESNIDALSYASMYKPKNSRFISLNGADKPKTMYQAIKDIVDDTKEPPKNIVLCLDNDRTGREATNKMCVPLQLGEKEIDFYISQPPRFEKEKVNEKNSINEIFKNIDNNDAKENNLKIKHDRLEIQKEVTGWQIYDKNLEKSYKIDDDKGNRNRLRKLFENEIFDVDYISTTKDWNEVLKHVKENSITLERPLIKPKFIERDIEKSTEKIQQKNNEMER